MSEWCRDRFTGYDTALRASDGLHDDPAVSDRMYRGGRFASIAVGARSANRYSRPPTLRGSHVGLRPSGVITD